MVIYSLRTELDNDNTFGCHKHVVIGSETYAERQGSTYGTVSAAAHAMTVELNKSRS